MGEVIVALGVGFRDPRNVVEVSECGGDEGKGVVERTRGTLEARGARKGGECKCMGKKGGRGVLIIFLGNSYDMKNMVRVSGPREEGKYFSRISES